MRSGVSEQSAALPGRQPRPCRRRLSHRPLAGTEQANARRVCGRVLCRVDRRVRRGHRARRGLSLGSGVPRPPGSSLRRLVFGREKLHHQGGEL